MGLYRRGKIYWFSITYQGKRLQRSLETENRRQAEKFFAKILTDIVEGRYFQDQKSRVIAFKELGEKYLSKYQKQRDPVTVKRLYPYFGKMKLADITAIEIEDYILGRSSEGAAPATIYQEFALGRRMFNVARKKWKWVMVNPFSDVEFSDLVQIDNARDRWLTVDEERKLLDNATPTYLRDIITFAINTGCRRGEILALTWKGNIDLKRKVIKVKASKGGKFKAIPMTETLYRMLLRRSKIQHISGRVFPVEVTALKDAFERAVKKTGIKDLRFHDLRHTFATRLVQAGVDLYTVKKLLGHKSIKMTERYAHHSPESLRVSVEALDICYNSATFSASGSEGTCMKAENSCRIADNWRGSG